MDSEPLSPPEKPKRRKPWRFLHKPNPAKVAAGGNFGTEGVDQAKRKYVSKEHGLDHAKSKCRVCLHASKDLIEAFYLQAYNYNELQVLTGIKKRDLDNHFRATGLEQERSNNTDAFYSRIITLAWENMKPEDIPPELLKTALWMKDKINGRIIDRHIDLRPSKIVILGAIGTEKLLEKAKTEDEKVIEGTFLPALSPAQVQNGRN